MRMSRRLLVGVAALVLGFGTTARAQVETGNKGKLTFKGFVSATLFAQDATWAFGDGQNAEFPAAVRDLGDDPWFLDGDVRNTRLNLTYAGPELQGVPKLGAALEVDFFGGTFAGGFQNAQPIPRLRLAYADLGLGGSTLRIGQAFSPWFGNFPLSLSHIAFPLGYGSAGNGGWRFPGMFLITPLTAKDAPLTATLTLAAMRNTWPGAPGATSPNQGSASLIPQLEARLDVAGKAGVTGWSAYVVGHYDRKDIGTATGRGDPAGGADDSLDGYGGEVGAKINVGRFMLQGNAYWAQAMGHQFMNLTQFGDIQGFGGWAQAGFDFTPNWGVYAFYGFDDPDDEDVLAAITPAAATATSPAVTARLKNQQAAAMLRYKTGPYQLGAEYLWDVLDFADVDGESDVTANQIALSVQYAF